MLLSFRNARTAWNDYFSGNFTTNLNSQTFSERQTPSDTGVYVSNCLFNSFTSTNDGGALYCTSVTYFLVESSSFFSCKTSSSNYGAIHFSNSGGQSVLYKVCGNDCNSNLHYHFAGLNVNSSPTSKNYVNYSSVVRCMNEKSGAYHILGLFYGKICCPSVNSSSNKCCDRSGIGCWPTFDSNSVACSLVYSSFVDNNATAINCIILNTKGAKFEIKSCNILRNTQVNLNSDGTIYISGYLRIDDSCILENKANNIFYQIYSQYTVTLTNCTADKTTSNQNVVIQSTVAKSFILGLNHMSTQNCNSEYDSAGTLTPIIQTPSKKQIICHTYVKVLYHLPTATPQIFLFFISFYFSL
jgi:hypothetical protein